mgnify:FL=1
MGFPIYKLKQISLVPDEYGKHLKVKMLTQYDEKGKYIKHIKIDDDAINILENGIFMPKNPDFTKYWWIKNFKKEE